MEQIAPPTEPAQAPSKKGLHISLAGTLGLALAGMSGILVRQTLDNDSKILRNNQSLASFQANKTQGAEISESLYFEELTNLLKEKYVEPVTNDQNLASGAVRGMILSLGDVHSLYRNPQENATFHAAQRGKFSGIGVQLALKAIGNGKVTLVSREDDVDPQNETSRTQPAIPRLVVADVAPGGPAEMAGLKVGDAIVGLDGRWVINQSEIRDFQQMVIKYSSLKDKAQRDALNEKIKSTGKTLRAKLEKSIMPIKAWDQIVQGDHDMVTLDILREGGTMTFKIPRKEFTATPADRVIAVNFEPGGASKLADSIGNSQDVTLDLRHNIGGSAKELAAYLAAVAPAGTYGYISGKGGHDTPVKVSQGAKATPSIKLLVDGSTSGVAEAFAKALAAKKLAVVEGVSGNDLTLCESRDLPDGSGYSIKVGTFSLTPKSKATSRLIASPPPLRRTTSEDFTCEGCA